MDMDWQTILSLFVIALGVLFGLIGFPFEKDC